MKKEQHKANKKEQKGNLPNLNLLVFILAFVPIFFSGIFQGGYFEWETYLTFLLSLPSILLFSYLKFVKGAPFKGIQKVNLVIFLFLLVSFILLFFTIYFYATLTEFYKVLLYVFMFYIAINTVISEKIYKVSLNLILLLSFILALLGFLAYIGYKFNVNSPIFNYVRDRGFANSGIIASTLQYSNTFGAFLVLPMFIALGFFIYEKRIFIKVLYILLFVFLLVVFILTQSRGAILTFLIALLLFILLLKGKERLYSFFSIAGFVVILGIVAFLKKDVIFPYIGTLIGKFKIFFNFLSKGNYDQSLGGRIYMIRDSLKILKDYPIFGTGFGTYQFVYAKYRSIYFFSKFPHSLLFQYIPESGVVGAAVLLFFVIILIYKGYEVIKRNYSSLNVGLYAGAVGILLHAFIDFDWSLMFMPLITLFSFGLLFSQGEKQNIEFGEILNKIGFKKSLVKEKTTKREDLSNINRIFAFVIVSIIVILAMLFPFLSANVNRLALANQGRVALEKTISDYETAILFNPLNANPHYNLANLYSQIIKAQSKPDQSYVSVAKSEYQASIRRCPMFFLYHYDYGKLLYFLGDKESINEFKKTIEVNPLDPGAHASLAIAYINLETNLANAKSELDLALSLGQDAINKGFAQNDTLTDIYIGYGLYYEKLGDVNNAIENYRLAISVSPKNSYAYYKAGTLETQFGMLQEGIQHLFYSYYYNSNDPNIRSEFEKYAPIIIVGSPKNGETYKKGSQINISWVPSNNTNVEKYVIWLIPPQGDWILVNGNISTQTLTIKYTLPKDIQNGTYTLRIYAVSHKIMQGQLGDWISYGEVKFNISD
ncbi:O-antigen ligase family protein [Caldisericum exile]|uniref:Hypothetical membrane protein n=1 Tax=Caldisericum exile (strain DSM 21853 / NBRC 104410 / AZM16c01) TaxID=511051 RepID=A0A7U6JGL0_CALEA|nr:O-antigen ligase family protein [Caldisericum exile]BAL81650.1 hypothetical membrane protein [Caldisericum exile AZM16c01]